VRDDSLGRALIAEAVGTFTLVFAGCGAIALGDVGAIGVAAAFGLAIFVMVEAFGPTSGAHFNPAVTAAFALSRQLPLALVVPYWLAQGAGALGGALLLRASLGTGVPLGVTSPAGDAWQAFTWEVVLTFLLVLVILAVATGPRLIGQSTGLAIGATVALGALVGGPLSGASMNPARSLGPALVAGDLRSLWIYLSAPFLGALIAVVCHRATARAVTPGVQARP
jgi:aquaporin NIP